MNMAYMHMHWLILIVKELFSLLMEKILWIFYDVFLYCTPLKERSRKKDAYNKTVCLSLKDRAQYIVVKRWLV